MTILLFMLVPSVILNVALLTVWLADASESSYYKAEMKRYRGMWDKLTQRNGYKK